MSAADGPPDAGLPGLGFRSASGGGAAARFAPAEAALLRGLVGQVAELIGEGTPENPPPAAGTGSLEDMLAFSDSDRVPEDPILARLLPDAYRDDPEAAGEFRRYTENSLRSGKVAAAQTVLDTLPEAGGRVRLSQDEAQAWMRSLNDVRLAIGVQLDVTEDAAEMIDRVEPGSTQAAGLLIYDWLSLLLESLVHSLW